MRYLLLAVALGLAACSQPRQQTPAEFTAPPPPIVRSAPAPIPEPPPPADLGQSTLPPHHRHYVHKPHHQHVTHHKPPVHKSAPPSPP